MNTALVVRSRRFNPCTQLNPFEYNTGRDIVRQTVLSKNIIKALEVYLEEWLRKEYNASVVMDYRTDSITIIVPSEDSKFPSRRVFANRAANLYVARLPFDMDKLDSLIPGYSRDKRDRIIAFDPVTVTFKDTLNIIDYFRGWSVSVIPFQKSTKLVSYVV